MSPDVPFLFSFALLLLLQLSLSSKMAVPAPSSNQPYHVRSFSLPSTSHPAVLRVEDELRKLTSSAGSESSTPDKTCDGLKQLGGLYESFKYLLSLTSCQLQSRSVEEELDASIRLLELCGTLKDSLTAMKEHIQGVRSAVRRRDGAFIAHKVNDYIRFGRKADKEIKNCFRSLKAIEDKCIGDSEMSTVIRMMREAKTIAISLLQQVSTFFARQTTRPKSTKWPIVSKALSKRRVVASDQGHEDVFFSMLASTVCSPTKDAADGEMMVKALSQLQMLQVSTEGFESGLECLFRKLIQLRVSLLNLLNPH